VLIKAAIQSINYRVLADSDRVRCRKEISTGRCCPRLDVLAKRNGSGTERAWLCYRKPYCARHSSVSWDFMVGRNPQWVAAQRGHSIATMLRVYAAWTEGAIEADIMPGFAWRLSDIQVMQVELAGKIDHDLLFFKQTGEPIRIPRHQGERQSGTAVVICHWICHSASAATSQMLEKTGNNWRRESDSNPAEGRMESVSY
jgi:hypothetical protein